MGEFHGIRQPDRRILVVTGHNRDKLFPEMDRLRVEEAYNELSREAGKTKYVFRDNGICSTSTTPNGSLFFFMLPVEMRILLPKGSHGLFIEHSGLSLHGERELLLAPDTDFQLIGVEKDNVFSDYIAEQGDKRNMGKTKLIMYLKVLPKEAESPAMNAA